MIVRLLIALLELIIKNQISFVKKRIARRIPVLSPGAVFYGEG